MMTYTLTPKQGDTVNKGCKSCRYFATKSGSCLHEDFHGQYQKRGLIGECNLFNDLELSLMPKPEVRE